MLRTKKETFNKEIEDDFKEMERYPCLWIGRINTFKWPMCESNPKDLMQFLSNYPYYFFHRTRTMNNPKIYREP